jgi:hypothetical protein
LAAASPLLVALAIRSLPHMRETRSSLAIEAVTLPVRRKNQVDDMLVTAAGRPAIFDCRGDLVRIARVRS